MATAKDDRREAKKEVTEKPAAPATEEAAAE
jgi:hypothetical protein